MQNRYDKERLERENSVRFVTSLSKDNLEKLHQHAHGDDKSVVHFLNEMIKKM